MAKSLYSLASKKRWAGISTEERAKRMSKAAQARWKGSTDEMRKDVGAQLAKARFNAKNT